LRQAFIMLKRQLLVRRKASGVLPALLEAGLPRLARGRRRGAGAGAVAAGARGAVLLVPPTGQSVPEWPVGAPPGGECTRRWHLRSAGWVYSKPAKVGQLPLALTRVRASLDCTPLTTAKSMLLSWLTTTSAGWDLCDLAATLFRPDGTT
jgi:hypothetical protein